MATTQPTMTSIFTTKINVPSFTTIMAIHAILWISTLIFIASLSSKSIILAIIGLGPILIAIAAHAYGLWLLQSREQTTQSKLNQLIHKLSWGISVFIGLAACILLIATEIGDIGIVFLWFIPLALATTITGQSSIHGQAARLALMVVPAYIVLASSGELTKICIATLMALGGILFLFAIIAIRQIIHEKTQKLDHYASNLQSLKNRFKGFYHHKTDWAWVCDRDHVLTYLSPNAALATGPTTDDNSSFGSLTTETTFADFLDKREHERFVEASDNAASFDGIDLKVTLENNEQLCFSLSGQPILDDDGNLEGYQGWAFDITPIVNAREKQKNYQTVLEKKIRVRTEELETQIQAGESNLQKLESTCTAQQQATLSALKKMETSVHNILEKIKPLTAPNTDIKYQQAGTDIDRICVKLERVINNLPFILKIDHIASLQDHEIISLDDLTRRVVHELEPELITTKNEIIIEELSGLQVFGDKHILEKAIYELLFNAVQCTPANEKISVFIAQDARGIHFICEDKGLPIHDGVIRQLKEYALGKSKPELQDMLDSPNASILLTSRLVQTHNGTLTAERNRSDSGNTVSIHLPKARLLKRPT